MVCRSRNARKNRLAQKTRGQSPSFSQRTTAEKCRPPCSRLASMLLAAGLQASAGHPFAQATIYQEGFFSGSQLLVQQVVGLVDQADENIGHNIGRTSLDVGPIGLIRHIGPRSEFSNKQSFTRSFLPEWMVAGAEKVTVIFQQFLQAGAGHID